MATTARSAYVRAPVEEVWAALADFDSISRWADNVDHSCFLERGADGADVGTTRRIQTGRTTVVERIVEWVPKQALAYDIEGLPNAIANARNRWTLASAAAGTDVTLTTTVEVGPRPPQLLVARVLSKVLARQSEVMLAGLTDHLESNPA